MRVDAETKWREKRMGRKPIHMSRTLFSQAATKESLIEGNDFSSTASSRLCNIPPDFGSSGRVTETAEQKD